MIVLACETSTLLGSVAIVKNEVVLAEKNILRQGSHSETLNVFINDCLDASNLKLKDIDCFSAGLGPGSFTGLRISMNTIKTFGYVQNKSVWGANSLFNLAYENKNLILENSGCRTILPMINAYKNMVYIAQYDLEKNVLHEIKPPQVVRVQELDKFFDTMALVVGDGYDAYKKYFSHSIKEKILRLDNCSNHPTARTLGLLTARSDASKKYLSWHELLPIYLRSSEAEEVRAGIKYQAL